MTCHDDGLLDRCGDYVHYVPWPEAALARNVRPGAEAAYRVTDGCCLLTGYRAVPVDSGDSSRSPLTCHVPCAFERGSRSRWIEDIARERRLQAEDGVLDARGGFGEADLDDMRDAMRKMAEGIPNAMKLLEDR